jgi:hypothetical protein
MNINIKLLSESRYDDVTKFLLLSEKNLFYSSFKYKNLIERHLDCKSRYFIAVDSDDKISGFFPVMVKYNKKLGNVINSLPYYGSNGSIITLPGLSETIKHHIRKSLLDAVEQLSKVEKCVASTFITNPFDVDTNKWLNDNFDFDFQDSRIGQITTLPENGENLEINMIKLFEDPRPRNIRKAVKSGITCYFSNKAEDLDFLYETHYENINAINGIPKKKDFFTIIPEIFDQNDFRVYIAEREGKRVAALLLFYFNKTVEYFTPATVEEFRNLQPSALLIYQAMLDAVRSGYKYWNWGGTWLTQNGVYEFKKKWGSKDYPYYYYTKIYDKEIVNCSKEILLEEYPNFFVLPFNKCVNGADTLVIKDTKPLERT